MTQIEKLMTTLKCSREEAEDIVKSDLDIDRGKRTSFDLDPEAEKEAKKMANVGTKKASKTARKPKENPEKRALIGELVNFLVDYGCVLVHCTNPERQIAFQIGENDYELTLVAKRKPKN
jgi:hypothetical protein